MSEKGVLDDAQAFYRSKVHGSWVYEVLRDRRLASAIRSDGGGYAPADRGLLAWLRGRGHDDAAIVASGLVTRREDGQLRQLLWGRMTIPVLDSGGRLVGFVGRRQDGAGGPKYVNTIYRKGGVVYGLHAAAEQLREGAWPVIVEGIADVWAVRRAAAQHDLPLAPLAVCGTALTTDHVAAISEISERPLSLLFDADGPGGAAMVRAWETITETRPRELHRAIVLPAGTDPAALWANSPQTLARALRDPVPAAHAVADVRLAALDDPATDVNARHSAALYLGRHDLPRIAVTEVTGYIVHVAGKLGTDPATANSSMIEGLIPTVPSARLRAPRRRSRSSWRESGDEHSSPETRTHLRGRHGRPPDRR